MAYMCTRINKECDDCGLCEAVSEESEEYEDEE